MTRAFLGLGSNLGDRRSYLRRAVGSLRALDRVVAVSPVYQTSPIGGPEQGWYLNVVVELDTTLDARGLLGLCRRVEQEAQRAREARWGPRTLDADVLWVDGEETHEPDLVVPHPRMRQRRFVLVPLRDLAPDLATPEAIAAAEGAVRLIGPL